MNNKGFAISGMVYAILIIFLLLVFSVLSILVSRKNTLDKIRDNALSTVTGEVIEEGLPSMPNILIDWNTLYINSEANGKVSDYFSLVSSPLGYTINSSSNFTFGNKGNNYSVTYTATDSNDQTIETVTKTVIESDKKEIYNYDYTGEKEMVSLSPGIYKLEVWSAQGAYNIGYIVLDKRTTVYVYVGDTDKNSNSNSVSKGGTGFELIGSSINKYIGTNTTSGTWLSESSSYLESKSSIESGNNMIEPNGQSSTGHIGNGYARITQLTIFE